MSNITKLAPYAYLAKRNASGTIYDLFLLVPVDSRKTVDLSNVQPVKGSGSRVFISYTSLDPDPNAPATLYKFKHFEIDSEGIYADILLQGDNSDELTTLIAFDDSDTEPSNSNNDQHSFAPYLFIKKVQEDGHNYFCPSSIVFFEGSAGSQSESLTVTTAGSTHTLTPGDNSTNNPDYFTVNQDVRHEIPGFLYTFSGEVNAYTSANKPIRKGKVKRIWAIVAFTNGSDLHELSEDAFPPNT